MKSLYTIAALLLAASSARADVKLPAIFSDHMVLQRDAKVPLWGTAFPNEKITVTCPNQSHSTTADPAGQWRVTLDPLKSSDPFDLTVNTLTLHDVLPGDVWLCSGQSNMSFPLTSAANAADAIKSADHPTLRLFMVGRVTPDQPQSDLTGHWELCTPDSAKGFSAVAYFFATELQQSTHAPVGLIQSAWGGTRAEAWLPRPVFDALHLPYEPAWTEEWLHPKQDPKSKTPPIVRPHEAPATLYNGMIHPLIPFAIRGTLWYQGETNTAYPDQYHDILTSLITSWRKEWNQGDFPFLIVQLANLQATRFWPTLRAAQAQVANELPNTALAVTIDVGNPHDIHPTDKQTVGHRLALAARNIAYHETDLPYSGPTLNTATITGPTVTLTFNHTHGGLTSKTPTPEGFQLAGPDNQFHPATATLTSDTITLTSPDVPAPTSIRYAYENDPQCSLYNKAGLPAVPFEFKSK